MQAMPKRIQVEAVRIRAAGTWNRLPWAAHTSFFMYAPKRSKTVATTYIQCHRQPWWPENMDPLIAAHAATLGAVLVTNDDTLQECSKHIDVRQTVNWADDVG
jgi:hypothetical protein